MPSLKRKTKKNKVEEYKPSLYPSFSIYSSDGINLGIDEKSIGNFYSAKVKLTGVNKRTTNGKQETDWSFEIQSLGK